MKHILIDANNFMMIAMSVAKRISKTPEDYESTFKRLMISMLNKIQKEHGFFSNYYVIWDAKGGADWRKEQNSGYKSTRVFDTLLIKTTEYARGIFEENMFPQLQNEKTEADDLLYALAENLSKDSNNKVIIVTRDKDLLQAVQNHVANAVYDPVGKKYMQVPDYDIVMYKCLAGDSSDHIQGLKGVGDKTAIKMINEGFDKSLIEETYKIVCIPANPRYPEFLQVTKEFMDKVLC